MGKNIYNDQKSLKMMKTKKMKTMMRKTMLMKTMLMKTKMMKAMTMKAMMMKTMMMKMMIMKTLMMKTVMMADQQQDSLSAAKAVPEELQVQVRASFLAREKPWIEKSEKTKVIQCFKKLSTVDYSRFSTKERENPFYSKWTNLRVSKEGILPIQKNKIAMQKKTCVFRRTANILKSSGSARSVAVSPSITFMIFVCIVD